MSSEKKCAVCDDKALGFNFNVVTCESCKAFFRRNALSKKQFSCPFKQECDITVITRKFCQYCRLTKCLRVGMKRENIMSDFEKISKRRKIESNRAKEKLRNKIKSTDLNIENLHMRKSALHDSSTTNNRQNYSASEKTPITNVEKMTPTEMVNFIVNDPDKATEAISKLMRTSEEAVNILKKITSSDEDGLLLISHLINYPGGALKIISKITNSPFNALTVFTKLMSCPTDTLKIIWKAVSSPQVILKFIRDLLESPDKALDIMNKFMNTPADALHIINCLLSTSRCHQSSTTTKIDKTLDTNNPIMNNITVEQTCIREKVDSQIKQCDVTATRFYHIQHKHIHGLPSPSKNCITSDVGHNPIDSVLSEICRIEFQTDNNLPKEVYTMQEDSNHWNNLDCKSKNVTQHTSASLGCNNCMHIPVLYAQAKNISSLNEIEIMKLRELKIASEALYLPLDEDLDSLMCDDRLKSEDPQQDPKLLQVINLTAVAIKRLIKMAKKISSFRDMCQDDQVALLKGGCTEMMIMRSVINYDNNRNTWKIPHTKEDMSNIRAEVLKLAKGNVYEEHLKFISTFDEKWRMDENIILILCAIVLFTPSRQCVIHSDVIRSEQDSYFYLLRRYLESLYSGCMANWSFVKLAEKISEVARLNQFIIGVYLNANPLQVEPLLREIFDLKHH